MTFGRLGSLGVLGNLGGGAGRAGFIPGASADLRFDKQLYYVGGRRHAAFTDLPGVSVSGGANGTVTNDGVITSASAPRIGRGTGLVVEGNGSELFTHSAGFANASWLTEAGLTRSSVFAGPVQGYLAQRFDYASGNGRVQKTVSITTDRHTVFIVARPISPFKYICARFPISTGGNFVTLAIDADDLSVAQTSTEYSNISAEVIDDGFILVRFEFVSNTAPTAAFYVFGTDTIGANSFTFAAPSQAGAFDVALLSMQEGVHTTPIVTEGSLLTRTADSVTLTDLDALGLTSSVLAGGYTVYVEWRTDPVPATDSFVRVFTLSNSTDAEQVRITESGGSWLWQVRTGGTNIVSRSAGALSVVRRAVAVRVKPGDYAISNNGTAPLTDSASGSVAGLSELDIGQSHADARQLGGAIKRIVIFPRALSDAQLQALTA